MEEITKERKQEKIDSKNERKKEKKKERKKERKPQLVLHVLCLVLHVLYFESEKDFSQYVAPIYD